MYRLSFGEESKEALALLVVHLVYFLDNDVVFAFEAKEMHEHSLRIGLVVDWIENVHVVDDHIFTGNYLLNRCFLHVWVPFRISLDVDQRLNQRFYLDGHGDINLDEVWSLLFVVDLDCFA